MMSAEFSCGQKLQKFLTGISAACLAKMPDGNPAGFIHTGYGVIIVVLRMDTRTNMKERNKQDSDYSMKPISRSPAGGGRGFLAVLLICDSAALVQSQGPSLFIIKSCDSSLVTIEITMQYKIISISDK